ncbi:MAG: hypothetical protein M1821_003518 [Bathelium mastoideum]|nr:MAG: hypothetical protein M1821_003518 [Bathelium mastoideum]
MERNVYIGKRLSYGGSLCTAWNGMTQAEESILESMEAINISSQGRSSNPTAGSFVRPNRPRDLERSFLGALSSKYGSNSDKPLDELPRKAKQLDFPVQKPITISGKVAEEVGFDKIRQQLADLHELRIVILDGMGISQHSREATWRNTSSKANKIVVEDIQQTCPKISELDLSRNLFEKWNEISHICGQLKNLRSLRLDGNRLETVLSDSASQGSYGRLDDITELSLSNTLFIWWEIAYLTCGFFGKLTSLVASSNELSSISKQQLPKTIQHLDLEDNDFTSLNDISPLAGLPNLERLSLRHNKLSCLVDGDGVDTKEMGFLQPSNSTLRFPTRLADIDLSHNNISEWSFVSALHYVFPGMTSLRIAHNPLFQDSRTPDRRAMTADDGYAIVVARLPRLKNLNFSPITGKDRLNAETYYLSLIAAEVAAAPEGEEETVTRNHWRYQDLCLEYGDPVVKRRKATVNPDSLAARLIKLHFQVADEAKAQLRESERKFTLELPRSLQVYSVMGYVGKRLGLVPMKVKLVWETDEWDPIKGGGDSESGDEESVETNVRSDAKAEMVKREVVIVAGTRAIGTWLEGDEARIRIELMGSIWHSSPQM